MTEEDALHAKLDRMIELLELIYQELRNGGRPKVGVVSGNTSEPEPTVDAAPVRG